MNLIHGILIVGIVTAIIGFGFGLAGFVTGIKLSTYLKKHKYDRWRDLTTIKTSIGDIGPGAMDNFKSIKYIRSDEDIEDNVIRKWKLLTRVCIRYFGLLFLMSLVIFTLCLVIIAFSKR